MLLEGVQRVMVHEHLNGLLRWQQMSQVLDRVPKLFVSPGRIIEILPRGDESRCVAHGLLTNEKEKCDRTGETRQNASCGPHGACLCLPGLPDDRITVEK